MAEEITSLKQRLEELAQLNNLAQALSSTLNVDEMLDAIVECCLKLSDAERVSLVLIDPSSEEIVKTLVRGPSRSRGDIDHTLNSVIAGWVLHHGKPLITENVITELKFRNPSKLLQKFGPALALPLQVEGKVIGVINLVNSRGGLKFSNDSIRVVGIVATLASQLVHKAKLQETLFEDNRRLKDELKRQYAIHVIMGQSPAIQGVVKKIGILSSSTATVLLTGETGTGKELVARAIHLQSPRAEKPFIAINCAAIPAPLFESELFGHVRGAFTGAADEQKGKFELANKGTLFLDEISEMPHELQPKLLRVLEERRFYRIGSSTEIAVDVRIIAASSKDLNKAVELGEFREALFHRLNVLPIHLPPLRERLDDIPVLTQAFIAEFSMNTRRFTPEALEFLRGLEWKGNVRELRNTVERISIFIASREITTEQLLELNIGVTMKQPSPILADPYDLITSAFQELLLTGTDKGDLPEVIEKKLVQLAMQNAHGNVAEASRLLGIHRRALERRINKYKIKPSSAPLGNYLGLLSPSKPRA